MNILFCDFNEDWHEKVINGIIENLDVENIVSISILNHNICGGDGHCKWIEETDISQHIYKEVYNFDCPPVDAELIEKLLPCEELYLEMMNRNELHNACIITYQDRKYYYYKDISLLLGLLKKYKIDQAVFQCIPHIGFDYLLLSLCKEFSIRVCIHYFGLLVPFQSSTSYFLSDPFDPLPGLNKTDWEELDPSMQLPQRVQAYIDQYSRKKDEITSFVYYSDFIKEKKNKIKENFEKVKQKINEGTLRASLRRKYIYKPKIKRIRKLSEKLSSPMNGEKFIYFPLHYQPEATTLPMGGFYYDQLLIIKLISFYLPKELCLYVKPHPHRSWFSDERFYLEISKLPNVKLMSDKTNTYDLIDNCKATVAITGTVICESLVRNKPVLMFGYYMWQYAPGVYHCKSSEDVRNALYDVYHDKTYMNINKFRSFLLELDKYLYDSALNREVFQVYKISETENVSNLVRGFTDFITRKEND